MAAASRNVVLQLTAPGTSALASLRLRGDRVAGVLAKRFSRPLRPGHATHGQLRDDAGTIDDPLVVLDGDSRGAELHLHGGISVRDAAIGLFVSEGFEHVHFDPEDASIAALLAPGVDAIERDVIASLPLARTERATRALLAQIDARGSGGDAAVDPTDRSLYHMLHPPTVAIVGIPNAGKSTLANRLFARRRSIVSDVAGTTRDWVGEEADLDGLLVRLIDTPGRRETDDAIEAEAIARAEPVVRAADLVILLLDATVPLAEQQALLDAHPEALRVVNKSDAGAAAAVEGSLAISAANGTGVDSLVRRVLSHFGIDDTPRKRYWLRRHWPAEAEAHRLAAP